MRLRFRPRRRLLWLGALVAIGAGVVAAPTASAAPTPVRTPTSMSANRPVLVSHDWRSVVNFYRATAGLVSLSEEPAWSAGNRAHAKYMVHNRVIEHREVRGMPYYTAAGDAAARSSNLFLTYGGSHDDFYFISGWMAGPFHAAGIIDPRLARTGYGRYSYGSATGAGLDVIRGLRSGGIANAVVWPGPGAQVPLVSYSGHEWPDPLTHCAGYPQWAGLPVIALLPPGVRVTNHSLTMGGASQSHCVFDAQTYRHPDHATQTYARSVLAARNTVVLIPRSPLQELRPYTVTLVTNTGTLKWSFTSGEVKPPTGVTLGGPAIGRPIQPSSSVPLTWRASDESGIKTYDLRVRSAKASGGAFGPLSIWQSTSKTSGTFTGKPGYVYCFSLRATDTAGNRSRWTGERCTALPVAATELSSSQLLWSPQVDPAFYTGVAMTSLLSQSTLSTNVSGVRRLGVLVSRCMGCGTLDVEFAGQRLKSISLNASSTQHGVLVDVARFGSARSGTVTLRVTSSLQNVTVEGLGVSPR